MKNELEMLNAAAEYLNVPESDVVLMDDPASETIMVFDTLYVVVELTLGLTEFKYAIFQLN